MIGTAVTHFLFPAALLLLLLRTAVEVWVSRGEPQGQGGAAHTRLTSLHEADTSNSHGHSHSLGQGSGIRCGRNVTWSATCNKDWGWQLLEDWAQKRKRVVEGYSVVDCAIHPRTFSFCRYNNITMDFGKARVTGLTRTFEHGFFTTYGTLLDANHREDVPGRKHVTISGAEAAAAAAVGVVMPPNSSLPSLARRPHHTDSESSPCDVHEARPTILISHDDIFNLGHHLNDVAQVWLAGLLGGVKLADAQLLNVDGFREDGPSGGPHHRLMVPSDVDTFGPYAAYYETWFPSASLLKRAKDYASRRVCFSELYLPPHPYFAWCWNTWYTPVPCAQHAPSPLYQSFNLFLRQQWARRFGPAALPLPDAGGRVHVVLEVRSVDPNKTNEHSRARRIANLQDLRNALVALPDVRVTAQDFAALPFPQQVALAHSAGVFVSMHGAGTAHGIFHAALGAPNCCALVELQPDHSLGYDKTFGYANLARLHGLHYARHEPPSGATGPQGTTLDVHAVADLVRRAVAAVRAKPTCLHDARDTASNAPAFSVFRDRG
jgi:hypothetical protein